MKAIIPGTCAITLFALWVVGMYMAYPFWIASVGIAWALYALSH